MNVTVDPRPDLPDGCRVKSSIEGTLRRTAHNHAFVVTDDGRAHGLDVTDPAVTTERIPEPEPEWRPGDVVLRDPGADPADRSVATYVGNNKWTVTYSGGDSDTFDAATVFCCPTRTVVRGGEVVQP